MGSSPVSLQSIFASGEKGWVRIPVLPYGICYQERTGASATTVCANGDPVGTFKDLIAGTYWTASADARRPIFTVAGGLTYLDYDGTDDCLVSAASIDLSGTNKLTYLSAEEADTGSSAQIITELSTNFNGNNGSFYHATREQADGDLSIGLRGNASEARATAGASLPRKALFSAPLDLSGAAIANRIAIEVNGAPPSLTDINAAASQTGNFGNYTVYHGARANSSLRFNGRVFAEMCVGRELTAAEYLYCKQLFAGLAGISL